jgi:ferritin
MINEKMSGAMNKQIVAEWFSAYLYLSMAAYFQSENLPGFAHWMKIQASEEYVHGMKFFDYIHERGGKVELAAIEAPKVHWQSAEEAIADAYKHEQLVTSLINNLMGIAFETKDYASVSMLNWFVDEQVEEEATADGILQKIKMIGGNTGLLLQLDKELGMRVFTPPPAKE